jgi:hypothetical protein
MLLEKKEASSLYTDSSQRGGTSMDWKSIPEINIWSPGPEV